MYIVISYKSVNIDSEQLPLYLDSTEKYFANLEDAEEYRRFLTEKYPLFDTCLNIINVEPSIDINEIKRKEALSKLTEEEKQLLGVN